MGVEIKFSQSYFMLNSWVLANIIQLGTQSFCDRFINYAIDPGRRLYDQMVLAARCGVANIAEGSASYSTSMETEMKLIDVARASIDEMWQADVEESTNQRSDAGKGILGMQRLSKMQWD